MRKDITQCKKIEKIYIYIQINDKDYIKKNKCKTE